jgi:hypothetical protein
LAGYGRARFGKVWLVGLQKGDIMANKYRAAKGARFSHKDAQIIGTHFFDQMGGMPTPELVVEDARSIDSPTHEYFEWDDTEAARQHRLFQARNIINHLVVEITVGGEKRMTKAFHSVDIMMDDETVDRKYASVEIIVQDKDLKEQVIKRALEEVNAWQVRWLDYSEVFGGVFKAVDKVKKSQLVS